MTARTADETNQGAGDGSAAPRRRCHCTTTVATRIANERKQGACGAITASQKKALPHCNRRNEGNRCLGQEQVDETGRGADATGPPSRCIDPGEDVVTSQQRRHRNRGVTALRRRCGAITTKSWRSRPLGQREARLAKVDRFRRRRAGGAASEEGHRRK